ncbi:MAG: DUF1329 domain-containing protein [Syntrophorhabdaceae bacterium]|nr:DUF1329 domain-containing protein [Syntrophorhabdaceae bacterium]
MKKKTAVLIISVIITLILYIPSSTMGQEMPKPGDTIDKGNYKKYSHLFPAEFLPAFEDGFGGFIKPLSIKVSATKSYPVSTVVKGYSAKNKGRFGLDAQGNVTGGWDRNGEPFPDIDKNDKDFATKLMWNYDGRYQCDDQIQTLAYSMEKRKGEPVRINEAEFMFLFFTNRAQIAPKPKMDSPNGLLKAMLMRNTAPASIKNIMTLSYRYIDHKKPDDTYIYLPTMRRVLRGEAGQRSTPVVGSTQALDDFNIHDGRVPDFTYTIVGEQKVLAVVDTRLDVNTIKKMGTLTDIPYPVDNYEVRDVYVIDIKPKDPKYPQSKKRIWVDKENSFAYYGVAWDRAGKVWKIWNLALINYPVPGGGYGFQNGNMFGLDIQFGMATMYATQQKSNTGQVTYNDVTPSNLLKLAR